MDSREIMELVSQEYGKEFHFCEKYKNIYKLSDVSGEYCLKVIRYQYPHFYFIISAMNHLQKQGFDNIPELLLTVNNRNYIKLDEKYCYLSPWIPSRESNYDNPFDLNKAAKKLAELHTASEGFTITREIKPRVAWFQWLDTFNTRGYEILDFKKRINQKANKSEFDNLYLSIMQKELERVYSSIENIKKANYIEIMREEIKKRGFCHHDYAHHNVLVGNEGKISIIDFDYCILDTHLHDLSSLIIRALKDGKWDRDRLNNIIEGYSQVKSIKKEEIPLISGFMEFPQAYWQIGIQYYWEQQNWGEEFFIKKLNKYIEDREERQEFIEYLRSSNLGE